MIPYLADAVPGWFQAALALYDAKGNELAYADHFRFHPDPVLYYEIPKDGEYVIEINDSIYRGREDFVYRITVGELPFVTSIFPLGGRAGHADHRRADGLEPAGGQADDGCHGQRPGHLSRSPCARRNWSPTACRSPWTRCRNAWKRSRTTRRKTAQPVTLPIIVNGRIDQPGDWDVFRFEGRAGEQIVAEVYARRLDSPLDSVLRLTDAAGRQLAFNDDHEDKASGLNTHHADSYLIATLPADGNLLPAPGRRPAQGRPGVRLPPAHQPAAARFRAAGRAVQHQRPRRHDRSDHRLRPAEGRLFRRDRPGLEGRPGGIHLERRPGAGRIRTGRSSR